MKNRNQKGQSLVMILLLTTAISAIIAVIGSVMMKSRGISTSERRKDELYYAAKTSKDLALADIFNEAYIVSDTRLNGATPWNNSGYVFKIDPADLEIKAKDVFARLQVNFPVPAGPYTLKGVMTDKIKTFNNAGTVLQETTAQASNVLRYRYLFCNDKNTDGVCDFTTTSEEGITLLGAPVVDPLNETNTAEKLRLQKYSYRYSITSYAYYGGRSDANFFDAVKNRRASKVVVSGVYDLTLKAETIAQFAILQDTSQDSFGFTEYFGEGDHIKGPLHFNGTDDPNATPPVLDKTLNLFKGGGANPNAIFDGKVSISNNTINFYGQGNVIVPTTENNPQGINVNPQWNGGFKSGAPLQKIPTNTYANSSIALGGSNSLRDALGNYITSLPDIDRRQKMFDGGYTSINPLLITPAPTGVYVTHGTAALPSNNLTGGVYIQGDVDNMNLSVDTTNPAHELQNYSIVQGTQTTNITIDKVSNQTTVAIVDTATPANNSNSVYTGLPRGQIQVEGKIKSLSGPQRDPAFPNDPNKVAPAIQKDIALNISATGNIVIQGDIKYETDPRGATNTGWDANSFNAKNVLGIFSATGKVVLGLGPNNPSGAMGTDGFRHEPTIDATIMAGAPADGTNDPDYGVKKGGEFLFEGSQDPNVRPPTCGSAHILGGVLTHYFGNNGTFDGAGLRSGLSLDFEYDRRNSKGNPPPYFPTETRLSFDENTKPSIISIDEIDKKTINSKQNTNMIKY